MSSVQLIRINHVTVALANLYKVSLDEKENRVSVYVKDRTEPFRFVEDSPEKATSLYIDLCKVIQTTQQVVPFLFFANVAIRLELLTAIHVDDKSVVVSTDGNPPDVFAFSTHTAATEIFDQLMQSLGIGKTEESASENVEPDEKSSKKIDSEYRAIKKQKGNRKRPKKVPR